SKRRHTRFSRDWSSDVCSSDLVSNFPTVIDIEVFTNQAGDLYTVRFFIISIDSVITNVGVRCYHNLSEIRRVGKNLLIPGSPRVETNFSGGRTDLPCGFPMKNRTIL